MRKRHPKGMIGMLRKRSFEDIQLILSYDDDVRNAVICLTAGVPAFMKD